jgi:predicted nucleic-acid-binding protein
MKAELAFADTNLFLRYLTDDVPAQADLVEALLRRASKGQVALVTTGLVVAEIVWTLESFYRLSKKDIQAKVLAILNTDGLNVADSDLVLQAIGIYAEKNVDFIDAYNAAWMLKHNVNMVYTFDQKHFSRFDGIAAAEPQ